MAEAKDEWLIVEVPVMVNLGPDSAAEWPEERCEAKAREIVAAINAEHTVSAGSPKWWVI